MSNRVLLIDGDIYAYRVAAAEQKTSGFFEGQTYADFDQGRANLDLEIDWLIKTFETEEIMIALSDTYNFRKGLWSGYKSNREDVVRPELVEPLKAHLRDTYPTKTKAGLEADDVLGIMLTSKHQFPDREKVCITLDKDLRSVPGLHWSPIKEGLVEGSAPTTEVTLEEADRFHLFQTLTGDVADGYPGCPGVGEVYAGPILDHNLGRIPVERVISRGPRKGTTVIDWHEHVYPTRWEAIVSMFEKAGLTGEDALLQARLARILRATDYNFKTGEVILWEPPLSTQVCPPRPLTVIPCTDQTTTPGTLSSRSTSS